jgi:peptidoglycan/LPS O-acetylase OafA/YrhL
MTTIIGLEQDATAVGDRSGTPPGDRRFRPDIEGLRAVAVLLVVLYHGNLSAVSGGYVGVDVFFVISGFVITGLLLRERSTSGRTSLLSFYGRRARRIIPAATLVIIVTVVATYAVLGVVYGGQTAADARWTAVFLANFHFIALGTNYLSAQRPPSPLQNFWSLAVEEQFYLVYPTIFLLAAAIRSRFTLRARLTIGLGAIAVGSFALSVVQTASSPTTAYFSPFTHAWELALGALVALWTDELLGLPKTLATVFTWSGLSAIVVAALVFTNNTPYPGSLVAVPVLGSALVIAGGVAAPRNGAEALLGRGPLQWLGKHSYSLYLWHWPLLVIAAEHAGKNSLSFRQSLVWLLVALGASVLTFRFVENPIRHAAVLRRRRWTPIGLGIALIALSLVVATIELHLHDQSTPAALPFSTSEQVAAGAGPKALASEASVVAMVRRATAATSLPSDLQPTLANASADWGGPSRAACFPGSGASTAPPCVFGDRKGTRSMVLYGDSHAAMWFDAVNRIAADFGWKLYLLGKGYCPADSLEYANPPGFGRSGGRYTVCDSWHRFAVNRINQVHPDLVVITQEGRVKPDGREYSPAQWQTGLEKTIRQIHVPDNRIVVLGNVPVLPRDPPLCLSQSSGDIQACSGPVTQFWLEQDQAEATAARLTGARYIDVIPWFCAATCPAVIGRYEVYLDEYHITAAYSLRLINVLSHALLDTPSSHTTTARRGT